MHRLPAPRHSSCALVGNTYSGRQDVTASSSGEFSFQIEHPGPFDTCLRFSVLSSAGVELLEVAELLLLQGVVEITVELSLDVSNPALGGAPSSSGRTSVPSSYPVVR